jgi:hypothetical protein
MGYTKYKPWLNEKQWLQVIDKLNKDQKMILHLFSRYFQETFTSEIAKELKVSEKEAYLNKIGGITRQIGKILNIKAGDNRWVMASRRRCGCIYWIMNGEDKKILRKLIRQKKL